MYKATIAIVLNLIFLSMTVNATQFKGNESQLSQGLEQSIESFWQQQGKFSQLSGVNNVKLAYASFIHPEAKADLLIVSGRTEGYAKYKEVAYDFYQLGYSVFMLDHRGQGFSERMTNNPHQGHVEEFQHYITDLDTFVQQVVLPNGNKPKLILAHSMGGAIAGLYLEQYPNTFDAAVLTSPMAKISAGMPELVLKSVSKTLERFNAWFGDKTWYALGQTDYDAVSFELNVLTQSEERYRVFRETYARHPELQLGGVTPNWLFEAINASRQLRANADKIKTPLLVLQAGLDIVVNNSGQDELCKNMADAGHPCWSGKPVHIAGAYHELLIEKDEYRDQAFNEILTFYDHYLNQAKP